VTTREGFDLLGRQFRRKDGGFFRRDDAMSDSVARIESRVASFDVGEV